MKRGGKFFLFLFIFSMGLACICFFLTREKIEVKEASATESESMVIKGDVSGDGNIDMTDLIMMRQYLARMISLTDEQLEAFDVYAPESVCDGATDLFDVARMEEKLLGLIGCFVHDYVAVTTLPTCTEGGYTVYTCSVCGDSYVSDYTEALGHSYGAWEIYGYTEDEFSCTLKRVCSHDSAHTEIYRLPALNKTDYVYTETQAAACESDGSARYAITIDGQTFIFSVVIPALGHDYGEWEISASPTSTTEGILIRTCKRDPSYTETVVLPELNETDYVYTVSLPATCGEEGTAVYVYERDGQSISFEETIPPTGHHFVLDEEASDSACEGGTRVYACSECGYVDRAESFNGSGHTFVNGECAVCGERQPENIFTLTLTRGSGETTAVITLSGAVDTAGFLLILEGVTSDDYLGKESGDLSNISVGVTADGLKALYSDAKGVKEEKTVITFRLSSSVQITAFTLSEIKEVWTDLTIHDTYGKTVIEQGSSGVYTEGLVFTLNADGASYSVSGYTGSDVNVLIPDQYEGLPVTEIADKVFYTKESIQSVTIGGNVISIGKNAFGSCTGLTELVIPASVKKIAAAAFFLSGLTSISFEDTSGWYVTEDSAYVNGSKIDLSNASTNAENLTESLTYLYKTE